MNSSGVKWVITLVTGLICVLPVSAKAERSLSRVQLEKEISHLRDCLHEAHLELADKADRIVELESLLKKRGRSVRESRQVKAVPVPDEEVSLSVDAELVVANEAETKSRGEENAGKMGTEVRSGKPGVTLTIPYEPNSAVNYQGREEVLQFVTTQLSEHPVSLFSVTGFANDSAFETKDLDIAHNRARFLVDYLTIKGVSEDVFTEVSGKISNREGAAGRSVIVKVRR
ncbi:MAG: hypothetical protein P1U58_04975 [Verrucomicrobiales bacterium]|nr:hypothetical protein [Verrucomicrobiales bacterium]